MASYVPIIKNGAAGAIFYVSLVSQANTKIMQANPTLAAGDVKIAIDDGAPANLGTLPVVDADFTKRVKVVLSQAETNGDNLTIIFADAAGNEWCDLTINIHTVARQIDDLAFPTTSGRGIAVETDNMVHADLKEWLGVAPLALSSQLVQAIVSAAAAAGIADSVWDEVLAGHLTAGSTGAALNAAGSAGDPWVTALPGAYTAGQAGNIVGNNLNATVSSRATQTSVDNVQADTDNIQTRLPGALVGGRMDSDVQAIAGNTGGVARLDRATRTMILGTVGVGSTLTSIVTSSLDPAATTADEFKGRVILFDKDTTTAALRGQGAVITANTTGAGATITVAATALTTAPASGDTFVID